MTRTSQKQTYCQVILGAIFLLTFHAFVVWLGLDYGIQRLSQLALENQPNLIDKPFDKEWFWQVLTQACIWLWFVQLYYVIPLALVLNWQRKQS